MLVIDYAIDRSEGLKPLSRAGLERLKRKPDGSQRLVIAYFSVGEAEEYRPYWQASWVASPPRWIIAENYRWPKNHLVKFWNHGCRDIIFAGAASYLAAIRDAGFDGVYLDRVDVYTDIADRYDGARGRVIAFVKDLAAAARACDSGFLVIVQNAEELLDDVAIARPSAVAKEDLLYGATGTDKRNADAMVAASQAQLDLLKRVGKPVFAVEYVTRSGSLADARAELGSLGYIGVFPPRNLDGSDLIVNDVAAPETAANASGDEPETGTPENTQAKCDGVWKRAVERSPDERGDALPPSASMQ
jgi:cysteinyl-tRNA synthetase